MPRVHLCCRSSVSLLTIHYPNVRPGSPCSSRSRLRSGQTSHLECSLSGWMSQLCIQSTIVVFKYHLFIQKNNVFVFAFYCAANRSDFFVRGWSAPNTLRRMPAASVNICFASLFFHIARKTTPRFSLESATNVSATAVP